MLVPDNDPGWDLPRGVTGLCKLKRLLLLSVEGLAARASIYQRGDLPPLRAPAGKAETKLELVESLSQTLIWDEYLPKG